MTEDKLVVDKYCEFCQGIRKHIIRGFIGTDGNRRYECIECGEQIYDQ